MKVKRLCQTLTATTLMTLALTTATASAANGRVYVRVAPPHAVVETRVVSPGPGYVWVPGYYRWERNAYLWIPGVWTRPPHPRSAWVAGHWAQDHRHGWYFIEGHWR